MARTSHLFPFRLGPTMRYAELHCKTNFSFLDGASHADELVRRAKELGYSALAVTDCATLAGVVRAHRAAKEHGLKLIVGAEVQLTDQTTLVLWAPDRAAYGRLSRLITAGCRRGQKGTCCLEWSDIATHTEGLLAGLVTYREPPVIGSSDCRICAPCVHGSKRTMGARRSEGDLPGELRDSRIGTVGQDALGERSSGAAASSATSVQEDTFRHTGKTDVCWSPLIAEPVGDRFRDIFGRRGFLLVAVHRGPDDASWIQRHLRAAARWNLSVVATGDVHYHIAARQPLHDLVTAIRCNTTVAEIGLRRLPNAQRHLRTRGELWAAFAAAPETLRRTLEVADRCHFSLDELRYEYPEELAPNGMDPFEYLRQLAWKGARKRYPEGVPEKVRGLLEHELGLIRELHYEAYFLTVWDLVRFARRRNILCQGRGSAANSAVCYCLGVTSVDPSRTDVLFERFVSRERDEAPDIDVDFEHERREEVLQYLYEKYGRERAGMTAEVIRYRARSAIRDVGKALGLSLDRVDALAKQVEGYTHEPKLAQRCSEIGLDPASPIGRRLVHLVNELIGFPRHLSQHVGGMVMTRGPLCELVPIENAAMDDRTVIQWDKDDLDTLGILKVDCLALGMLTALHRCFNLVRDHYGHRLTLANVPREDPAVYDMICCADTMGVFQIESRAQMSMLPRLKPRCYYDLVIEVAIVRPGPIQGQMVHPYLRRRGGQEPVTYPSVAVQEVLEKTLGVPIFQEQAMRLAVVAAGFTPGEADQLRRAMGAWRRPGVIDQFHHKLVGGMLARGLSRTFADQLFKQIRGFGEYGFPESHAASFALLVYVSAWLKCYYPDAYAAALINSQPMGFYAPAQLIRDAQQHGVRVLPVDVNFSEPDCTLEPMAEKERQLADGQVALRLGLRMLHGLADSVAAQVVSARNAGKMFRTFQEFVHRTRLGRAALVRLAEGDVFQSLGLNRRQALWHAMEQESSKPKRPLLDELENDDPLAACLPIMSEQDEVLRDYSTTGFSLKSHPIAFHRDQLEQRNVVPAARLRHLQNGRRVAVAGLVLLRQRPSTAKGITFVTLEDETGTANLVVHQAVWQKYYQIARRSPAWLACGRLESKDQIIHVVVQHLEDLSKNLAVGPIRARDFH